jgi:hypothetical protein
MCLCLFVCSANPFGHEEIYRVSILGSKWHVFQSVHQTRWSHFWLVWNEECSVWKFITYLTLSNWSSSRCNIRVWHCSMDCLMLINGYWSRWNLWILILWCIIWCRYPNEYWFYGADLDLGTQHLSRVCTRYVLLIHNLIHAYMSQAR